MKITRELDQSDPAITAFLNHAKVYLHEHTFHIVDDKHIADMSVYGLPVGILTGGNQRNYYDEFDQQYFYDFMNMVIGTTDRFRDHQIRRVSGKGELDHHIKDNLEDYILYKNENCFDITIKPTLMGPRYEPKLKVGREVINCFGRKQLQYNTSTLEGRTACRRRVIYNSGDPANFMLACFGKSLKTFVDRYACFYSPFNPHDNYREMNNLVLFPFCNLWPKEVANSTDWWKKQNLFYINDNVVVRKDMYDKSKYMCLFGDFSNFDMSVPLNYIEVIEELLFNSQTYLRPRHRSYLLKRCLSMNIPLLRVFNDTTLKRINLDTITRYNGFPSGKFSVGIVQPLNGCYAQLKKIYLALQSNKLFTNFLDFCDRIMSDKLPGFMFRTWGDDFWFIYPKELHFDFSSLTMPNPYVVDIENKPRFLGHNLDEELQSWTNDLWTAFLNKLCAELDIFKKSAPRMGFDDFENRLLSTTHGMNLLNKFKNTFPNFKSELPEDKATYDRERYAWDPNYQKMMGSVEDNYFINVRERHLKNIIKQLRDVI